MDGFISFISCIYPLPEVLMNNKLGLKTRLGREEAGLRLAWKVYQQNTLSLNKRCCLFQHQIKKFVLHLELHIHRIRWPDSHCLPFFRGWPSLIFSLKRKQFPSWQTVLLFQPGRFEGEGLSQSLLLMYWKKVSDVWAILFLLYYSWNI